MSTKPYSFRYPWNISTTLEAWRDKFGKEFDPVINLLTERDRALENHLSLDVAQGFLGIGNVPNGGQGLTASYADITGATVTVSVPANRSLKLSVYADIINLDAVSRSSFIRVLDENNTVIVGTSRGHTGSGTPQASQDYREAVFISPVSGTHTYRLQALINGGSGTLVSNVPANNSGGTSFLSLEDVGPVSRT